MFSVKVNEDVLIEYISESTVNDSIGNVIRLRNLLAMTIEQDYIGSH